MVRKYKRTTEGKCKGCKKPGKAGINGGYGLCLACRKDAETCSELGIPPLGKDVAAMTEQELDALIAEQRKTMPKSPSQLIEERRGPPPVEIKVFHSSRRYMKPLKE